ncbi:bifunctional acetaldehyde-CoA/alcohol dehydrogenase [Parageobacillus thermoglucosidasius]|uniref:bifunctional acetaldehyde-CoA/alcohol dehydrogenase n=1 Tax=Parageobacillus thermoglucosidasius TaxID=1426 RepID=UPI00025B6E6D|nr:bifunctional acetaldehyde-CoA/alcohol dehydrogenase [Parageobacillus thermoglucosidasius]KYD12037.1 Alcohol dehydrogenase [Anoxybacillus flavithermus]REK57009.1 MAG: bifunctional acetaldehyde-CoA/alcohol dehydrogenase [Geobacillus sp.]EID42768.1 bifunctional protein: acetaldehyde-CoA dehydrogenase /alcohol dehydrogenase [Parageobacillus thermoglucosidasius TNO-09.020]OAO87928.1 Alcohol dehydrogenase Acetaldehyde dehydrogenase [Parageobacillus thermoglucosidasius]GCD84558.1 aldehyde-alcohol 
MAVEERVVDKKIEVAKMIDELVANAQKALEQFRAYDQETIDHIVKEMALAGLDKHMALAKLAVEETKRGVYEDKIIKNLFATEYIYHNIKYDKTVGIIHENPHEEIIEIAEPVGVIAGITPVTNPTSTTMFKALISIKTRNPIIFAFHPSAQRCSSEAARVLRDAAVRAGAPEHCIQWIETPSLDATNQLMRHPGVSLILATGGAGMVKAAYSSGKPALGVGPGNVPCYIEKTANIKRAVNDLILSKTFDNGMICASEQAVIIDKEIYEQVKKEMMENHCYFLNEEEKKKVEKLVINENTCAVNPDIVGKPAYEIAKMAGIAVPEDTKILVAELKGVGPKYPLSREKLSPVLACYKVNSTEEGFKRCEEMLEFGGLGHSAVIHSDNQNVVTEFGKRMKAGRIIVNAPSSQGAIGDIYNAYIPSLTLGCGTFGGNSVSTNVSAIHLINIKRMAKRTVNMQWFKVPPKIYFEKNAVQYLAKMPDISRAFIVTDPGMVKLGYVDKVLYYLRRRPDYVHSEIFSEVEPDPSIETVMKGVDMMRSFEPDVIIALGGGSPMDAAKAMWLFYEHPTADFNALKQKFLDIRKRVYKYPKLGQKAKFVAIPTTSGTGSEVTSFAVITDKKTNIKYPLADYELTPDVAIVDPQFVMTVPKHVTADTGMDVLTHAIEAYVSNMANDYTDGLAMKAIQLVFEYLPRAYQNGADELAREKMHNASTIAGMAFANAFLGINHSLAHKLGAEFHIPHGRANTILMPHVIRYNAAKPKKFTAFPKYEYFKADQRYAEIARMLGLPARTTEEGVESLVQAIIKLAKQLDMPLSIEACGVSKQEFESKVEKLAELAFEDQCTTANPKLPLVSDLVHIYRQAFKGV